MKAINRIATLLVLTVMISTLLLVCTPVSVYAAGDRYWVGGMGTVSNGTGSIAASPTRLVVGANTIDVTGLGTLLINIPSGLTGNATSGALAIIVGSPVTLTVDGQTPIAVGGVVGTITITLTQTTVSNWTSIYSWSAASGGVSGASVPTSADSVFFDVNAFSAVNQTVIVNATANCLNMDWTGATNTPTLAKGTNVVNIYGSCTFISAMTLTSGASYFAIYGTCAFTSAGKTIPGNGIVVWGGTLNLQDALVCAILSTQVGTSGTINTNNNTATLTNGIYNNSATATYNLGSSVLTVAAVHFATAKPIVPANTSTINCTGSAFNGGGVTTYNIVNLTGATPTISGSNTFAQLNLASGTTQTVKFTDGTTQTITSASLSGSAGHVHTLQGTSTAGWTITKAGGGRITSGYLSVAYSTANPDTTFYAWPNGTNAGNNTRWYFTEPFDDPPMQAGTLYSRDIVVTLPNKAEFSVTWEAKPGATYLVQAKRFRNPLSPTDGYFVYTGTSNVCTAVRESNTRYIVYWLDANGTWILWANQNVYRSGVY